MGTDSRRWAHGRSRKRARFGPGTTLLTITVCLLLAASLVRSLAASFDWAGMIVLAVVLSLLIFALWPVRR